MQYGVLAEADSVINIALRKSDECRGECFTAGRDLINRQIRYLRAWSECVYVG